MAGWSRVKWSEARQVLEILRAKEALAAPEAAQAPAAYFEHLRANDHDADAVKFLGQALPRLEAVAWAARTVRDLTSPTADRHAPEARALRAALLWVGDPTEARRRAAYEAAEEAEGSSPESLAAMAAFCSGGSIAPADCPVLPAPRDAAGLFASGAVLAATAAQPDIKAALKTALDAGAQIAARGLESADA